MKKDSQNSSGSSGQSIGVSGVTNNAKQLIAMMVEKNQTKRININ